MNDILLVSICTIILPILILALCYFFFETKIGETIFTIFIFSICASGILFLFFLLVYNVFLEVGFIEPFLPFYFSFSWE